MVVSRTVNHFRRTNPVQSSGSFIKNNTALIFSPYSVIRFRVYIFKMFKFRQCIGGGSIFSIDWFTKCVRSSNQRHHRDGRWEIHTLYAEAAVTKCPVLSLVSDSTSTKLQSEQINTRSVFYIAMYK